ncbi:phosphotransferase [Priestia megaterium]|uniref:phosphotransferase n=1 Tax=Priestia megaterium TaxID=1404 RepID=UPI00367171B9
MDNLLEKLKSDPMARYVPSLTEIKTICNQYDIGDLVNVDGELGGLFNVNIKITTTTGQYVIRVHSGLSRQNHIEAEKVLLGKLLDQEVPVLTPLNTKSNEYLIVLHGRFVQLTPFFQGVPFRFSKEQVYQCGRVLRKLHDALMYENGIPSPFWSNYPTHVILQEGMEKLKQEQTNLHEPAMIRDVEDLYQIVMENWLPKEGELIRTIIHADWHPWNVLFDETTTIRYVLDFDFLQTGERIHDIAYFLWAIRESDNNEELGSSFLNGYGALTSVEVEMLPLALARVSLFFLCTASFNVDPAQELQKQMKVQKPYIKWLLSQDGMLSVKDLYRM